MSYIDKFYHLDKVPYNKALLTARKNLHRLDEYLNVACGNDNDILRAIFAIGQRVNVLPNDLDISITSSLPVEVARVLESLHRQFPSAVGFRSPDECLNNIISRYDQFGGELTDVVDSVVSEIEDLRASMASSQAASDSSASQLK